MMMIIACRSFFLFVFLLLFFTFFFHGEMRYWEKCLYVTLIKRNISPI